MTDTSPEAIAALCERLRNSHYAHSPTFALAHGMDGADVIARLVAERDAALGAADKFRRTRMAEGARQERAAIVAWLLDDASKTREDLTRLNRDKKLNHITNAGWEASIMTKAGIVGAIERGDHLKGADHD